MYLLQSNPGRLTNTLNPVLLVLAFLVLVWIRTTAGWFSPFWTHRWDILTPFLFHVAYRRSLFEGTLLWFVFAHLYSLCSVAPIGLFAIQSLILFVIARAITQFVNASGWFWEFGILFLLAIISRCTLPLVARGFGEGWNVLSFSNLHPAAILYNTVMGFIVLRFLSLLDRFTNKVPQENIELGESAV